ncbi:SGNH/GDSL hydrolase family protein [Aquipuribacter hungaricus]|uniref:SGNH/GDSL hydrolase family protein n=2 Tax=Aquipuribacter hungaricus TaxID=545624 RepID=A0ABV7WDA4_9MICO
MSTWAFVGDSVTAARRDPACPDDLGRGWVADVAGRLRAADPAARVLNLGVSGDRLAGVRARAVRDLAGAGALVPGVVVTCAVGINDVRRAHLDERPLDVDAFAAGYAGLLDDVRAAVPGGGVRLVLLEPLLVPVDARRQGWVADVERVRAVVREAGAATGAVVVGGLGALLAADAARTTTDGVHPTRAGHALVAQAWWDRVVAVPGLLPGRPRGWDRLRPSRRTG